jgi:hypothetical protein
MAFGDIFKRKKKQDYLDLEGVPGAVPGYGPAGYPSQGMGGMPSMSGELPGLPPMEQFPSAGPMMPAQQAGGEHLENIKSQIESINYKLDTLKAVLDSLNSRLANIETALKASPLEKGEGGWNY